MDILLNLFVAFTMQYNILCCFLHLILYILYI